MTPYKTLQLNSHGQRLCFPRRTKQLVWIETKLIFVRRLRDKLAFFLFQCHLLLFCSCSEEKLKAGE